MGVGLRILYQPGLTEFDSGGDGARSEQAEELGSRASWPTKAARDLGS